MESCLAIFLSFSVLSFIQFSMVNLTCMISNKFTLHPDSVLVREGDNVEFVCSVDTSNSKTYEISWDVSPVVQEMDVSEAYEEESYRMTSTMTLYSVTGKDRSVVCKVQDMSSEENCYDYKGAWIIVQCFPTEDEIACGHDSIAQSNKDIDLVTFHCRVKSCNPPVDIGWRQTKIFNDNIFPKRFTTEGQYRVLTQQVHITQELYLLNVTCLVTSEVAFGNKRLECDIGPLHKMSISFPAQQTITNLSILAESYGKTTKIHETRASDSTLIPVHGMKNASFLTDTGAEPFTETSQVSSTRSKDPNLTFKSGEIHEITISLKVTDEIVADVTQHKVVDTQKMKVQYIVGGIVVTGVLVFMTVAITSYTLLKFLKNNTSGGMEHPTRHTLQTEPHESTRMDVKYVDDLLYEVPDAEEPAGTQKNIFLTKDMELLHDTPTSSLNSRISYSSSIYNSESFYEDPESSHEGSEQDHCTIPMKTF